MEEGGEGSEGEKQGKGGYKKRRGEDRGRGSEGTKHWHRGSEEEERGINSFSLSLTLIEGTSECIDIQVKYFRNIRVKFLTV